MGKALKYPIYFEGKEYEATIKESDRIFSSWDVTIYKVEYTNFFAFKLKSLTEVYTKYFIKDRNNCIHSVYELNENSDNFYVDIIKRAFEYYKAEKRSPQLDKLNEWDGVIK